MLENVDQQKSVNVYLHIHAQRECSAEEPFMGGILCHVTAGKCNWRHFGWSVRLVGFPQCYLACRFLTNKMLSCSRCGWCFRMKKRKAENYQLICVNVSTSEDARLTVYRSGDSTGV